MSTEGLTSKTKLDVDAYRNGLTSEQMVEYLSEYFYMAKTVVKSCPEHRLLALSMNGCALKGIKKSEQTLEEVVTALRQNGCALTYVSKMILRRNPRLYKMEVESNGLALHYVPANCRYEGIYEDAVRSNPAAIELVPADEQSRELFLSMVKSNGLALRYVPKRRISKKISRTAFESDARSIQYIPCRFCDREMALAAVASHGSLLKHVPEKLIDAEVAAIAVANDGEALGSVPSRLVTPEMCRAAVDDKPVCIRYVPPRLLNDFAYDAVSRDWRTIHFVPRPSRELLDLAFGQCPLALQYFPQKEKTSDICEEACSRNPKAFPFVPRKLVTTSMLIGWLTSFLDAEGNQSSLPTLGEMEALKSIGRDCLRDPVVARLMRRLGMRRTTGARWIKKSLHFVVTESISCDCERVFLSMRPFANDDGYIDIFNFTSRPKSLDELDALLGGDLSMVEFRDYSFDDYDASRHDISSVNVPVETLRRIGAYDSAAYYRLVSAWVSFPEVRNPSECVSLTCAVRDMTPPKRFEFGRPFYYVSDLHLNHMLVNKFPTEATERQILDFLTGIAVGLAESVPESERTNVLLVLGDTSFNIEVAEIFFRALRKAWEGRIVCVLGNHELWDWSGDGPKGRRTPAVGDVVDKYREMLGSFRGICLLQNQALVLYRGMEPYYISEDQLRDEDDNKLTSYLHRSSYVILGGIGFSGLCDEYNAEKGLYRDVVTSRAEDTALSDKFSKLHERIRRLAPDANVIVATHTPMSNWSSLDYQPGWVYVSGHTHRNTFVEEGDARAYADNQIGYSRQVAGLKRFYVEGRYDPFRRLSDGIHEVEHVDYLDFNRTRGIPIGSFNRKGQILMLKRESVYLFLFKWERTGDMYLLSGGRINKIEKQDPKYYFERMIPYVSLVKKAFSSYMSAINTIAEEVRAFGGEGRVHGCIVDIDLFNHVYLDPFTGRLKFYFATSIDDRIEYDHLDSLLKSHARHLLPFYEMLLQDASSEREPLVKREVDASVVGAIHKTDMLMYRPSNVVLSVQRLFYSNVIRVWNDEVFEHANAQFDESQSGMDNVRLLS
ncbi:MAG: metallophosphoesterase [Atopobiaceae bacterium]|nr:metallophosphoesterase [Atopobiaceae bacterium]